MPRKADSASKKKATRKKADPPAEPEPAALEPEEPESQRGSTAEQAKRNLEIVAARNRGLSWVQVGLTYGLSDRQARRIYKDWAEITPTLRHDDAMEIVDFLLRQYEGAAEELALISATAANESARVGAVNARGGFLDRIERLLQATGSLPQDLGELRIHIDAQWTATQIVALFEEYGMPEEAQRRVVEVLEAKRLEPGQG